MPDTPAISSVERSATLDLLGSERFDCAVIGGGITGAGIAREATQRGLTVALLEAEDFSSGTSSRSSKLIHGGLRYLAMGDIALVRETALERKEIHRLAPHLAEPRWVVVPTRSRTGLLKMRAGITTYEKLGAVAEAELHRNWSRRELESEEPNLDRSRFAHACVYREYLTDDARLVLANLRCAAARGAVVLNHARVDAITGDGQGDLALGDSAAVVDGPAPDQTADRGAEGVVGLDAVGLEPSRRDASTGDSEADGCSCSVRGAGSGGWSLPLLLLIGLALLRRRP